MRGLLARLALKAALSLVLSWTAVTGAFTLGSAWTKAPVFPVHLVWFLGGGGLYLALQFLLYRPLLSHVLAHELTHALAAVLTGGKVTAIHATTSGGSTTVNRSGAFISLSPYVFPFYAALLSPVYAVSAGPFRPWIAGLIGFSYVYHLFLTVYTLLHHQPDLQENGTVFSLIFIVCGNIIVAMLLTLLLWPEALTPASAVSGLVDESVRLGTWIAGVLGPLFTRSKGAPTP